LKLQRIVSITILAGLTLLSPPAGAQVKPALDVAEAHLEAWRLTEAQAAGERLLSENSQSPEILDFNAQVMFYLGRYEDSLRYLEQALARDSASERRQALRLLTQRTLDTVKKLKRFESAHFTVYLDDERDGILLPHIVDALEKTYQAIGQELGYFPSAKVRVEIAPDAAAFNAISTLSLRDIEETGAVGICKFNKIMTISPRALVHGYRWLDSLSHEYLHYAIVALSDNKAPIWLHEGLARFYETRWRRANAQGSAHDYLTPANETLLAQALEKNKFVGFKNMEPSLIHLETPEEVQLAYAEAASAIDFMIRSRGAAGIRQLLGELRDKPVPQAVENVAGTSFENFEAQWKAFLKAKGLKEIEGTRVRRLRVKKNDSEDSEAVELKEIQSVVARNRTHLGDQLLGRGRMTAAVQEYRRALGASPHSTVILNKLARALMVMRRYDEALPHLEKARSLDPDNPGTYVTLGQIYHTAKNSVAARAALEEAIQINPFNPAIYRLLQDTYNALGEPELAKRARATLEKLLTPR
jgi:tetratricopeptide (TPR) repeat protein